LSLTTRLLTRRNKISVVIPIFEEASNLRLLCARIRKEMERIGDVEYEVLLIDDGSHDNSWDIICQLHDEDDRIRAIRFSRNFGHQAAVTAGYRHATGDAVITMDGDLQHPPELLPQMIARWRMGFDVVSMVREQSAHEGTFKSATSRLFYRFINALSDVKIRSGVADFRLLDRRVVRKLNSLKERGRFVRGLISWVGFRETEIRYIPNPRFAGTTKYSLRKMCRLAVDAVSSFSTAPLRMSFVLGLIVNVMCVVGMGYAVYNKLHEDKDLTQWASTFLTMLFLSGVQLLMIGVLGIYVGRIFEEVKGRPLYIAAEELGISHRPRKRRALAFRA
jgi:dolichol-phosphate mannosyltransferase